MGEEIRTDEMVEDQVTGEKRIRLARREEMRREEKRREEVRGGAKGPSIRE